MTLIRTLAPDHASAWPMSQPQLSDRDRPARSEDTQWLRRHAIAQLRLTDVSLRRRGLAEATARLIGSAAWPINAFARAGHICRRMHAQLPPATRPTLNALLMDCWRVAVAHNIPPKAYFKFRLFEPANRNRRHLYLMEHESSVLLRQVMLRLDADLAHRINDKLEFHGFAREYGLPTVPLIAAWRDGQPVTLECPEPLPQADLMIKVTNMASGVGVDCLHWDARSKSWTLGNSTFCASDLDDLMRDRSRGTSVVLQPRVHNHAQVACLAPEGVSTIRMLTASIDGQDPEVCLASIRMPTGTAVVDNRSAGGLSAAIDLGTGRLIGPGVRKRIDLGWRPDHPDTRHVLHGTALPHWQEAKALCLRAHDAARGLPTIGWDVIITDSGPKLLEGNLGWGSESAQVLGAAPLGGTAAVTALRRVLERRER